VFGIKNFLFRGNAMPADVPEDVQTALGRWEESATPDLDAAHFHTRYIVLDVITSGARPDADQLLGISAVAIQHAGAINPQDAIALDFSGLENDSATVDRQLMAFLDFVAKAPVVTYNTPFVGGFLQRAFKERLGLDFHATYIDLAWLLPSFFEDKSPVPIPLDQWLELFGMESGGGRRDPMSNALVLARFLQRVLVRAVAKEIDTPAKLIEQCGVSSSLRRNL
jgi:DNA polymerase III subunit epsilon